MADPARNDVAAGKARSLSARPNDAAYAPFQFLNEITANGYCKQKLLLCAYPCHPGGHGRKVKHASPYATPGNIILSESGTLRSSVSEVYFNRRIRAERVSNREDAGRRPWMEPLSTFEVRAAPSGTAPPPSECSPLRVC